MAGPRTADGVFLPGCSIGIVGGGQLGRMFALEARRMGYRVVVLDPGADAPAAQVRASSSSDLGSV